MCKFFIKAMCLAIGLCWSLDSAADLQWLPDHEESGITRSFDKTIPDTTSKKCIDQVGMKEAIPTNMVCDKFAIRPGVVCYRNCKCNNNFALTSCPNGYVPNKSCTDDDGKKYDSCIEICSTKGLLVNELTLSTAFCTPLPP